ncbi:MAG: hypothetical protein J6O50_04015 [Ruminiclostridium sp.]|nr:hypothetical protein [Ruminiclostridium sp.]
MRRYEVRTTAVEETTDEQIKVLAASFCPTIRAYYDTEEGRKMFEEFMNEVNGGEDKKPAA